LTAGQQDQPLHPSGKSTINSPSHEKEGVASPKLLFKLLSPTIITAGKMPALFWGVK
jgi:hypothetical protein